MSWINVEKQQPKDGERVIVFMPFGARVRDDTWMDCIGWLNHTEHISHWQPINRPTPGEDSEQ